MLNGKEESPLHEALTDLMQRRFMPERETLAAAQRALRFLVSGGWLAVKRQIQGHAEAIPEAEFETIITAPGSWARPASVAAPFNLEPTDLGVAAWRSGFPVLGLSEQARSALMFPQPSMGAGGV